MKTSRFLSVAAIAAAVMLSLTGGKSSAQCCTYSYEEDAIELRSSQDLINIWNGMYDAIGSLTTYYNARVSTYNNNLSAWSTWSSYATYQETLDINAILAGQNALLSDLKNDLSDLQDDLDGANNADYWYNWWYGFVVTVNDEYAQKMWDSAYHWDDFIEAFQPTCGDITNDIIEFDENYQPYFDAILQDIINRNS